MKRRHKNEYTPTNVSGRNKYKPPFLNQDKNDGQGKFFRLFKKGETFNKMKSIVLNLHFQINM